MFFTGSTLIGTSTLQTLIFPYHKYWMSDLEKTRKEILIHPKNFITSATKISANYPLFIYIKFDRNKTISIFVAHSWIRKIKHA